MNTRKPIIIEENQLCPRFSNLNFNQDFQCFSGGTNEGFEIYNTNPVQCSIKRNFSTSIGYTKMLYRTNYIALVGSSVGSRFSTDKLIIWDDIQQRDSIILKFNSPIKEIFLSRQYITIVLMDSLEIYTLSSKPTKVCSIVSQVHKGIADFVTCQRYKHNSQESITTGMLAYPSIICPGQIHLADFSILQQMDLDLNDESLEEIHLPTTIIKAHKNPIQLIKFSSKGIMVATCSVEGTLIRIFNTVSGSLLREFRRGLDRAVILDMSFSLNNDKLAIISDKFTLHIFEIGLQSQNYDSNKRHAFHGWLPKVKYLESVWSMCSIKLVSLIPNNTQFGTTSDICKIGWIDDESLCLIWEKNGIWEKYIILEKENHEINETFNKISSGFKEKKNWELIRESWRQL